MPVILVLGSGLMSESTIDYLLQYAENQIFVCSNIVGESQKLAAKKQRTTGEYLDVSNSNHQDKLEQLVSKSDIVISLIPAFLHVKVALVCLKFKRNMVTASYISQEMKELDDQVKQLNLTFLNEIGLDPGIDHLATMSIKDEAESKNEKIIEYESWCGGLASPEFVDNPLGYKFSWSPIGAFTALLNDAKFLVDGKEETIDGKELQYHSKELDINMALNLEGYPNRDSTNYKQLYQLKDAQKVLRGTLRYRGFSVIINVWKELGLFCKENVEKEISFKAFLENQLNGQDLSQFKYNNLDNSKLMNDIIKVYLKNEFKYKQKIDEIAQLRNIKQITKAFNYFKFFDEQNKLSENQSYLQNLVNLLQQKINLKPNETDLIVMQHIFKIQKPDLSFYTRKSTMIVQGTQQRSAMANTVGTPCAIGAQLILDKIITKIGVIMPNSKEIYQPILEKLEQCGIHCKESID